MEWLTQNWASLLLLAVVLMFLTRRGGIGCGPGREARGRSTDSPGNSNSQMHATAVDPVSGETVSTETALTSVYRGRVYYFSSRDNREKFETDPAHHAGSRAEDRESAHHHGGHGCC